MTRAKLSLSVLVFALAACTSRNTTVVAPQNDDERVADEIMSAVYASDMQPVVWRFVPERRDVLLDPKQVKIFLDYAQSGGKFLGAKEIDAAPGGDKMQRRLDANFEIGPPKVIKIFFDARGKIVHFALRPYGS